MVARPGRLVAVLDEEPIGPFAAVAVRAHADKHPAAVQPDTLQFEFKLPGRECSLRRSRPQRPPIAPIPQLHSAAAILSVRNRAFKIAVIEWVVFDFHGESLVARIKRRAFGYSPGFEHASQFEPQVVMQTPRRVLLYDEAQSVRTRRRLRPARLSALGEVALGSISG